MLPRRILGDSKAPLVGNSGYKESLTLRVKICVNVRIQTLR